MTSVGIGLVILAFVGLLVYYVRKGLNSERNEESLLEQNRAQADSLSAANAARAESEREERQRESIEVVGIDRAAANQRLRDALKNDAN